MSSDPSSQITAISMLHVRAQSPTHCDIHVNEQMVRELEMDSKTRALSSQTSSVPPWLTDSKAALGPNPRLTPSTQGRRALSLAKPLAHATGRQSIKGQAAGLSC